MGQIDAFPLSGIISPSTLAYAQQPSATTGLTTALTDVTGLSATITVPAGRRLKIRGHVIALQGTAVENKCAAYIMEGATKLGFAEEALNPTVGTSTSIHPECIITPSAGTHTYKIAAQFAAGSSNQLYQDPTNGQVCYLLIEDITGELWPVGAPITAGMIASEAWDPFVPTLTADTTNPTLGSGSTVVGFYKRQGRVINGTVVINLGSSGFAGGSGFWRIAAPVPIRNYGTPSSVGSGYLWDASASDLRVVTVFMDPGASVFTMGAQGATGYLLSATFPWTWANTDQIHFNFMYEAAS